MPARVQQAVREENLRFMKSRDVYCSDYYDFIFDLCQVKLFFLSKNMLRYSNPILNINFKK